MKGAGNCLKTQGEHENDMSTATETPTVSETEINQLQIHLEAALLNWGMESGSQELESMLKMMTDDARWLLLQHQTLRP